MTIWLARFESRNFEFVAIGRSKDHAKDALIDGLTAHGKQYDLETDWFCWAGWQDEIRFIRATAGDCLRDNEKISAL